VNVETLAHNWWMMAVRGGLAIAFGLAVMLWPAVTLPVVVTLFGCYALADGAWTVAAASRASRRLFDAWPVLFEGVVSVGLGLLSLLWPFVPRQFVSVLAGWGIVTGVLELLAAAYLPEGAGRWLLLTAGGSSLFLAFLLLLLPHADLARMVHVIAAYAVAFGVVLLLTALRFAQRGGGTLRYAETRS
jgi:uncharacterized membrane protein HdeD (DUF308 family)